MKRIRSLLIVIIGIIGTFATILTMDDAQKTPFLIVFLALIVIGIIILLIDTFIPSYKKWKLGETAERLGIIDIHPKGNSGARMSKSLKNAKYIRIFSTSGLVFIRTYKEELSKSLADNGLIRVMIAKQSSPMIFETEQAESRYRIGQIIDEFKQVEGILKECKDNSKKINANNTGKIEVGYFNTQIRIPMIICDNMYCWTTLTLSPKRSSESVSLELEKVDGGLLEDCSNHYNNIWNILSDSNDIKVL